MTYGNSANRGTEKYHQGTEDLTIRAPEHAHPVADAEVLAQYL